MPRSPPRDDRGAACRRGRAAASPACRRPAPAWRRARRRGRGPVRASRRARRAARGRRGRSTRSQLAWKSSITRRRPRVPPKRAPLEQLHELGGPQAGRDLARSASSSTLVEEVLPPLVEGQLALQLVEHGEPRRQPGLDRELEQDPPGERVQRADRGVVERRRARRGAAPSAARLAEPLAQPVAQLGGGLLGERDGGDRRRSGRPRRRASRMRPTSAVVLPAPAPASTNSVVAVSARMRSRPPGRAAAVVGHGAGAVGAAASGSSATSSSRLGCSAIGAARRRRRPGRANQRASDGCVALALPLGPPPGRAEAVGLAEPARREQPARRAARARAGKTPASMPSTTAARASPTRCHTASSNGSETARERRPEERVPGLDRRRRAGRAAARAAAA